MQTESEKREVMLVLTPETLEKTVHNAVLASLVGLRKALEQDGLKMAAAVIRAGAANSAARVAAHVRKQAEEIAEAQLAMRAQAAADNQSQAVRAMDKLACDMEQALDARGGADVAPTVSGPGMTPREALGFVSARDMGEAEAAPRGLVKGYNFLSPLEDDE